MPESNPARESLVERRARAEINRLRALADLPPLERLPTGEKRSSCNCPVARALPGVNVCVGGYVESRGYANAEGRFEPFQVHGWEALEEALTGNVGVHDAVELPPSVRAFIDLFDTGWLPQYEEPSHA